MRIKSNMRFALDTERYKMHCDRKDKLLGYDLTFNMAKAAANFPLTASAY